MSRFKRRLLYAFAAVALVTADWTLVVPLLSRSTPKAWMAACQYELKNIWLVACLYNQDNETWATSLKDLQPYLGDRPTCPAAARCGEGSGYCYHPPRDPSKNEPIAWDDAPRHFGQVQVVWEDGQVTCAPAKRAYETYAPLRRLILIVALLLPAAVSFTLALCAVGVTGRPIRVLVAAVAIVFGLAVLRSVFSEYPHWRLSKAQQDLRSIQRALWEYRERAGQWPASLHDLARVVAPSGGKPALAVAKDYTYLRPCKPDESEPVVWEKTATHFGRILVLYENGAIMLLPPSPMPPDSFDEVLAGARRKAGITAADRPTVVPDATARSCPTSPQ